ncbi:peptidase S9 prolyl oligopeptidase active site domain protein [Beutenbergia cavernae DSM 12333]|uniref:Peptidase S9 prolyl oligopeptidase active site domain protein n=1 Tax=Beutenbergia cavernae (strain ATCC BAA-8 / DSM 12333 / CCUG 43141 / JCM 11478 / NBRC 16432 / NCIMB 13614 / HKI 0122) TaxID=471853 RepID=C5C550_BEUC1|nr:prolyl oligopeptidase family serine peptidase [Beutenbergia cavernae]ACQ82190.1 peptidase S9 prolyl oligopeptidase active site domain protein [Beutenbergia cavernae DSM 12333]
MTDDAAQPATPFHDLDAYVALPRLGGLALAPDGSRLVVGQSVLDEKKTRYVTALWEVDPAGERPARRLTRGAKGEGQAAITPAGDLLFVAKRAEAGTSEDDAVPCVWRLPAAGGEAHVLARRPDGVGAVVASRTGEAVVVVADTLLGAGDETAERRLRKARKEKKVAAILHDGYPVRYWDHDLGPAFPRLFSVEGAPLPPEKPEDAEKVTSDAEGGSPSSTKDPGPDDERGTRDLTADARRALSPEAGFDLAPDGATIVASWAVPGAKGFVRSVLARIDVATGERTVIVDDAGADLGAAVISPDGTRVAYVRETISTPHDAPRVELWVAGIDGSGARRLVSDWDRWAHPEAWLPDGSALLVTADDGGAAPVFVVPVGDPGAGASDVRRLTADGAFTNVVVAPDGSAAFALRSSYEYPAEVVRVALDGSGVSVLPGPSARPALPGHLREVTTTVVEIGAEVAIRAFLAVPDGASPAAPAPLALWIHGGPLGSWNAWSWRWNPWLLVAQGYAVLLPDPALSTGYGQDFIQRGWGAWGKAPFTDLMAITDAAEALPEVDETRTAAMGGSFGGYMANWVAGHTDRFAAIVTHASLWALDQFGPTTDAAFYWEREMTAEMALENSPHRAVADITTPMLVVHGDKDYRVPIGEGLRLWYELLSSSGLPAGEDGTSQHRFLYFPDENHWVLTPQHAKVWYEVVSGFLARHVLGEERELPEVLG